MLPTPLGVSSRTGTFGVGDPDRRPVTFTCPAISACATSTIEAALAGLNGEGMHLIVRPRLCQDAHHTQISACFLAGNALVTHVRSDFGPKWGIRQRAALCQAEYQAF